MQSYDTSYKISHADLAYGRKLGEGGFGEVFEGTWQHNQVAIKKLKMQKLSSEAYQELETEAKMMAELRHDNIVGFRGFCFESPNYALVMEYMPRGSLYDLLHSSQDIDWQARIQISIGADAGLVYLHNKNILHRDIKSLNVLLYMKEHELHAKLTDFGLSKVKTDTKLTTSTSKGSSGTLAWMAPELFARRAKYEKATDVYSFAVMLWEIASRRIPFEDAHDPGLIPGWVKDGEREKIPEGTPELLKETIQAGWNQEIKDRPTAEQIMSSLRLLMQTLPKEELKPTKLHVQAPKVQPMSGLQGNYASGVPQPLAPKKVSPSVNSLPGNLISGAVPKSIPPKHSTNSFQGNLASGVVALPGKKVPTGPRPLPAVAVSGLANNLQTRLVASPQPLTEAQEKLAQQQAEIESLKNSMDSLLKMKEREERKKQREAEKKKQKKQERHAKREQATEAERIEQERLTKERLLLQPRLPEFLKHAVEGNLDAIKPLLESYPGLAMLSGDIKDPAGRQFSNITAFQYATWALDKELWELLLPYLPEGEALRQLNEFEQDQSRQHGCQIDFTPLLKACDNYLNNFYTWDWNDARDRNTSITAWGKIGSAQCQMPAWFIYLFCEVGKDKAWPRADFDLQFHRDLKTLTESQRYLFMPLLVEGRWNLASFKGALVRGTHKNAISNGKEDAPGDCAQDRRRLKSCLAVRTSYRHSLNDYLNQLVSPPQVVLNPIRLGGRNNV